MAAGHRERGWGLWRSGGGGGSAGGGAAAREHRPAGAGRPLGGVGGGGARDEGEKGGAALLPSQVRGIDPPAASVHARSVNPGRIFGENETNKT